LPLTENTRGILNADTFNRLKRGASVINAARGPHLVDSDLIEALNSGQIGGATLDVFHVEPLPAAHPFWTHPKVTVTPHVASLIDAPTGSKIVAKNIRTFQETGTVPDLADAKRGYYPRPPNPFPPSLPVLRHACVTGGFFVDLQIIARISTHLESHPAAPNFFDTHRRKIRLDFIRPRSLHRICKGTSEAPRLSVPPPKPLAMRDLPPHCTAPRRPVWPPWPRRARSDPNPKNRARPAKRPGSNRSTFR
jgi:hypothetical protein